METFIVTRTQTVEAASPTEAAFIAFKQQSQQTTSDARFSVDAGSEIFPDVTIANVAPVRLLTRREVDVAGLVMQGATNADIGRELDITERTAKAHISHIFQKFHVTNRVSLATKMMRMKQVADAE